MRRGTARLPAMMQGSVHRRTMAVHRAAPLTRRATIAWRGIDGCRCFRPSGATARPDRVRGAAWRHHVQRDGPCGGRRAGPVQSIHRRGERGRRGLGEPQSVSLRGRGGGQPRHRRPDPVLALPIRPVRRRRQRLRSAGGLGARRHRRRHRLRIRRRHVVLESPERAEHRDQSHEPRQHRHQRQRLPLRIPLLRLRLDGRRRYVAGRGPARLARSRPAPRATSSRAAAVAIPSSHSVPTGRCTSLA